MPAVLMLRALNLGDLLVSVPAMRALRRRYPRHRMLLAGNPALAEVAALTGAVDECVPHRGLGPPAVAAPDVAVDLHGVLPGSVRALQALRPRRLVAFACAEAGHTGGPLVREVEHEVAKWCRLVRYDGADADEGDLLLPPPDVASPRPGAAVLHPGAGYGSKRWPPARFAAVARALAAQGHEVVITGTAAERGLAARVAAAAGLPETANLAGTTGIGSLLALVHEAALVISGDTGVAHLATAYERPSVVLFGPASPRIWGPPAKPCHVALWHGTGEREVLADRPDPALLRITVPEVLAAAARVLAASPA
ncbi:ADP-heptose:LPS heptosyltransferase [Thermocatellispora tengchongensis]|uniref:ADP-heptose:LPS heptosyltransferase n=1 Tax=Thermocatellispora tengchongensis TaxID=1073253 RepID=A0A840P2P3_9ACTN|nr:glycosyltransferase family 9 protein [Thermocatellispora tengchongensis]MBB5131507.1 ADP-heptose:LPS heptosyltransferase [Thermocatellispora tengchongensis]